MNIAHLIFFAFFPGAADVVVVISILGERDVLRGSDGQRKEIRGSDGQRKEIRGSDGQRRKIQGE